jgi:hypothetical protein
MTETKSEAANLYIMKATTWVHICTIMSVRAVKHAWAAAQVEANIRGTSVFCVQTDKSYSDTRTLYRKVKIRSK